MPQFGLYAITFFFFLLSAIFATGTPTYPKRNRSGCASIQKPTMSLLPTTAKPFVIPSQALTAVPTQNTITPTQPATTPKNTNPATPAPSTSVAGNTSNSNIQAYLTAHNSVRAKHGAAPLTWSDNLASAAQKWANGCVFEHSGGTLGPFGENIAAGIGTGYTIAAAVKDWTDEVAQYDPKNPTPSHFTQVVWKATTQLGCAVQTCNLKIFDPSFGPAQYYVCEYSPAGNVIGSFSQNVQA